VDNVWEQKKLEARKMLENAAESPVSSAPQKMREPSFYTRERWSIQNAVANTDFTRKKRNLSMFLTSILRTPQYGRSPSFYMRETGLQV
jgi:hypothetical protein